MRVTPIKSSTEYTTSELKEYLGTIAVLEGDDHIVYRSDLEKLIPLINPEIVLTNVYKDFSRFIEIANQSIDTIIIESTFTYTDKIMSIYKAFISLYLKTGWKPKRIINTKFYGLNELYVLFNDMGIEILELKVPLIDDEDEFELIDIIYDRESEDYLYINYDDFFTAKEEILEELKGSK